MDLGALYFDAIVSRLAVALLDNYEVTLPFKFFMRMKKQDDNNGAKQMHCFEEIRIRMPHPILYDVCDELYDKNSRFLSFKIKKTEELFIFYGEDIHKSLYFRFGDYRRQCRSLVQKSWLLDHTIYDSALWETGHSFEKILQSLMFRETRSERQLGYDEIVSHGFGGKSKGDSHEISKSRSLDDKHLLGPLISTLKCALDQSRDFGVCPLYTFLLQRTGSTPLKNIPTSVNQVKQMSTTGNRFSLDNNESCVAIGIDLTEALKWDGKMTSQLLNCNLIKHNKTIPRGSMSQLDDIINQLKRKQTAQRVSSFVIVAYTSLCLLAMCSQSLLDKHLVTTLMQVLPLHKEHGPMSIVVPLLGLFGFMVFVWAVAIMILLGASFTPMQRAMLLFWAILMYVRSANSISAVYVPLLGIFFIGRYAHCKATNK